MCPLNSSVRVGVLYALGTWFDSRRGYHFTNSRVVQRLEYLADIQVMKVRLFLRGPKYGIDGVDGLAHSVEARRACFRLAVMPPITKGKCDKEDVVTVLTLQDLKIGVIVEMGYVKSMILGQRQIIQLRTV